MNAERYVLLGLAHVRSPWFTEVARWATSGSLPAEFVKCVSPEELRSRLAAGRPYSAAILDAGLPAVDRDLLAALADAAIPAVVVAPVSDGRDWPTLGAAAVVRTPLDRSSLLDALATHGRAIGAVEDHPAHDPEAPHASQAWRGRLVAVTGRPGAGTSTVSAALSQRLADDPRFAGDVVLVDLARHAHQALLHDARDVVPGIQEVVELHRSSQPPTERIRALAFAVPTRGYRLVLGLRRPHDWITIRPRAFESALDGLLRSARIVVTDTDHDLEGEAQCGSPEVEDRNLMARTATAEADIVVAVASATLTGVHGLVGQLEDLRAHGVPGHRILTVLNRAPRAPRARAELTRTVAALTGAAERPDPHIGPVFLPERRNVDALHRDLVRFPGVLADPVGASVRALLDHLSPRGRSVRGPEPVAVVPGSLGHWDDGEVAS